MLLDDVCAVNGSIVRCLQLDCLGLLLDVRCQSVANQTLWAITIKLAIETVYPRCSSIDRNVSLTSVRSTTGLL
jgi:hypothetical protein